MEEHVYLIGVNYGTSRLIHRWYKSAIEHNPKAKFIIVDNYSSSNERQRVELIAEELSIVLIKQENLGYGIALNVAIDYINSIHSKEDNIIIMCGNLDIEFSMIPLSFSKGPYVYIPKVLEGSRNRNPFITKLQSRFLPLHKISLKSDHVLIFLFIIGILKLAGKIPSRIWTIHGSLFCFNLECIGDSEIFNRNTFLYSEELEFGSYMNSMTNVQFIESDVCFHHEAHCATGNIISNKSDFYKLWKNGFQNWCDRWDR